MPLSPELVKQIQDTMKSRIRCTESGTRYVSLGTAVFAVRYEDMNVGEQEKEDYFLSTLKMFWPLLEKNQGWSIQIHAQAFQEQNAVRIAPLAITTMDSDTEDGYLMDQHHLAKSEMRQVSEVLYPPEEFEAFYEKHLAERTMEEWFRITTHVLPNKDDIDDPVDCDSLTNKIDYSDNFSFEPEDESMMSQDWPLDD